MLLHSNFIGKSAELGLLPFDVMLEEEIMSDTHELFVAYQPVKLQLVAKLETKMTQLIVETLNRSVAAIISVSKDILNQSDLAELKKFSNLYLSHEVELSGVTQSINEEVEEIFSAIQQQTETDEKQTIIFAEDTQKKNTRLAFANYQRHLEAAALSHKVLADNFSNFIMELQFHDLITQLINHIHSSFQRLTKYVLPIMPIRDPQRKYEFGAMLREIYQEMKTIRERKIFFYHFKAYLPFPTNLKKIPVNLNDDFSAEIVFAEFLDQYINFYKKILFISNSLAEKSIQYIGNRLAIVLEEVNRLQLFTPTALNSMVALKDHLIKSQAVGFLRSSTFQVMAEDLHNVTTKIDQFKSLTDPLIGLLQFQDCIQHYIQNFSSILLLFQQTLYFEKIDDINKGFDFKSKSFDPMGRQFLEEVSSKEERDIIQSIFFS